jgi:hypothetical protein
MPKRTVDQARKLLLARSNELRVELQRVEAAIEMLDVGAKPIGAAGKTAKPPRPRRSKKKTARARGETTSVRQSPRGEQAVELISQYPGIEIKELASRMGLKGTPYLYRLLPRLEQEGRVRKDGGGYRAT